MPFDRCRLVAIIKGGASRCHLEGHEWDFRDVKFSS